MERVQKFTEKISPNIRKKRVLNSLKGFIPVILLIGTVLGVCIFVFSLLPSDEGEQYKRSRKNDSVEFTGSIDQKWILKGNEFVDGEKDTKFVVTVTDEYKGKKLAMKWKISELEVEGEMVQTSDTTYEAMVDSEGIEPGKHELIGAVLKEGSDISEIQSSPVFINVSYPLYSVWTMDWEGLDVSQTFLNYMDQVSSNHNNMPVVQLYNPAIYVNLGSSRQAYLDKWVLDRKKSRGDEIGMHMHMWFGMVSASGVTPKKSNAWRNYGNGRDIPFSEYNYEESKKILQWGIDQIKARGLGAPISFRAGGWFADLENLKAMEAVGLKIDTSGRDGVAWGDGDKLVPSNWSLGPRTLPYHPSESNLNSIEPPPNLSIWEFPNNGRDSWTYSAEDMLVAFNDNFDDKSNHIVGTRRTVNYLSHPHWFNVDKPKLELVFSESDKYLFSKDSGPVVYTTLEKILPYWEADEVSE
jgi:hypothetical protein